MAIDEAASYPEINLISDVVCRVLRRLIGQSAIISTTPLVLTEEVDACRDMTSAHVPVGVNVNAGGEQDIDGYPIICVIGLVVKDSTLHSETHDINKVFIHGVSTPGGLTSPP